MKKIYEKLEDSYEDIKGACIDTLERNKDKYGLPIEQAIAYYMNEIKGVLEDNEVESVVTLISIGLFIVKNNFSDDKLTREVKYAINEIKSNKCDKLLLNSDDRKLIDKDIETIENSDLLK